MGDYSIKDYAQRFVEHKQAAGIRFIHGRYWIDRYIKHHESKYNGVPFPTKESVFDFVDSLNAKDKSGVTYIREFCVYLRILGVDAFVYKTKIPKNIPDTPYIITAHEGDIFFEMAHSYFSSNSQWVGKDIVLPALFTTMWCCGMRTTECRKLRRADVDLDNRHIDIMGSKFQKDRRIVLSTDLQEYLLDYDNKLDLLRPARQFFFPGGKECSPVSAYKVNSNFKACWYAAFPDFDHDTRIRLYDFRHHFVYANLNRWLDEGRDINVMIYYLMKVTGHSSLNELLYYFHLVPEIYQIIKEKAKDLDTIYPEDYFENEED